MRHRRGVDIGGRGRPIYVGELSDVALASGALREWECVGGRCGSCEHEGWMDTRDLSRRHGSIVLSDLAPKLRCRACGNRAGNRIILGRLPRD